MAYWCLPYINSIEAIWRVNQCSTRPGVSQLGAAQAQEQWHFLCAFTCIMSFHNTRYFKVVGYFYIVSIFGAECLLPCCHFIRIGEVFQEKQYQTLCVYSGKCKQSHNKLDLFGVVLIRHSEQLNWDLYFIYILSISTSYLCHFHGCLHSRPTLWQYLTTVPNICYTVYVFAAQD